MRSSSADSYSHEGSKTDNSKLTCMLVVSTMDLLTFVLVSAFISAALSAPEINAPWGRIQGVNKTSREGLPYYGYHGIRYAKPPVGELRFKKPVQHPGVSGVFNATEYGPVCLGIVGYGSHDVNNTGMDEDCLTLNVFLPNSTEVSSQKAVMVWIHGGGFVVGGAPGSEPWMLVTKADVIVVTIQYRLSVFGFLSTGSDVAPGNYGLWDQHLALKWVKTNIESFGGDKDNITIIGESSGAASVAYQILYPGSKGLFARAILQSAAATSLWAISRQPSQPTAFLAYIVGCLDHDYQLTDAVIECLRSKDSRDLLQYSLLGGTIAYEILSFTWVPSVDGDFVKKDPQILMRDRAFLDSTCIRDIDVMIGVNNNEGAYILYAAMFYDKLFNYTYATDLFKQEEYDSDLLPFTVEMSLGKHDHKINDIINVAYTYPRPPANTPLPQQEVMNTCGDPSFVVPGILFARTHASLASGKKCYFYLFNHYPSFTGKNPIKGMSHGEDSFYLFGLSPEAVKIFGGTGNITEAEYELSDTFVKFLADFAKSGDPNHIIEPKLGQAWPPFELQNKNFLSFTTNMSVGSDVFGKRASIWLDIPYLEKMWQHSLSPTTGTPLPAINTPRWFYMDQRTSEITIVSLIVVLGIVGIILVSFLVCWCVRHRKSPIEKYTVP